MNNEYRWIWRNPDHLEAHRREFARPIETILEELRSAVTPLRPPAGGTRLGEPGEERTWLHADFELPDIAGESGLREVPPDGSESFWAYRRGRSIPSHLCLGERRPTSRVCLWGWWEPDAFVIHTLYPGSVAPREIHDPEIKLADLPEAIEFWRGHAIVVGERDYATEPY